MEEFHALTDVDELEGFLYNLVITELAAREASSGTATPAPVFVMQAFLMYRNIIKALTTDSGSMQELFGGQMLFMRVPRD
jgi:hypothetical protein